MYAELFKSNPIAHLLRVFSLIPIVAMVVFAKPLFYIVYGLFDLWLVVWVLVLKTASTFRQRIKITDTSLFPSICWTTDLDYFGHMNNGRYLRELDNARHDFGFRSGLTDYIVSVKGGIAVIQASTIRYRKSINFLQRYTIKTRIIWYDEKALYFEQCFVTKDAKHNSDFICAIALLKCPLLNIDVKEMMKNVFEIKEINIDPEKEKELKLFIKMNETSSARLRGINNYVK